MNDIAFIDEINKKFTDSFKSKSRGSRNEHVSRTLDENEEHRQPRKLGKTPSANPYYDFNSGRKSKEKQIKQSFTTPQSTTNQQKSTTDAESKMTIDLA